MIPHSVTRCVLAVGIVASATFAQPISIPPLSDTDAARVVTHGPWPPRWQPDPSNRVSGSADAIALGALLFRDPRLSRTGTIACVTCHQPSRAFTDGLQRAAGLASVDRNTISVANVRLQHWFGWDGAGDSLWAQSLRPILAVNEMGGDLTRIATLVRSDAGLRRRYRDSFGAEPPLDDEALAVDVAKSLAAYQETLLTGRTPFDDFRDALVRGDRVAAERYPAAARRGLALFVGRGRCNVCHIGPNFTNGEFHDVGVTFFVGREHVDPGRYAGIKRVQASRYNLLGTFNDDPAASTATGTRFVALEHRNFGEFRVPSLRNVARTAPYMHNGSLATLRDVVKHYSEIDEDRLHADGERIVRPLHLSDDEIDDLVAFLDSLSDRGSTTAIGDEQLSADR